MLLKHENTLILLNLNSAQAEARMVPATFRSLLDVCSLTLKTFTSFKHNTKGQTAKPGLGSRIAIRILSRRLAVEDVGSDANHGGCRRTAPSVWGESAGGEGNNVP